MKVSFCEDVSRAVLDRCVCFLHYFVRLFAKEKERKPSGGVTDQLTDGWTKQRTIDTWARKAFVLET